MASLFFSYSHKDENLRDQLEVHLTMLKREGLISAWHDRRIRAGGEIDNSIDVKLEEAEVVLLLVSPDFLASQYCYDREVKRAMERHENRSARVIPVILRPCDWKNAPFGKLLAAPKDGKPVTMWPDRDEAFLDVVKAVRAALPVARSDRPEPTPSVITAGTITRTRGPRSSNLRLKKTFTDAVKDQFLEDAFEYMARFFESSLNELRERNPGIEGRFRRIDGTTFSAKVYRNGEQVGHCAIGYGSHRGIGPGIVYSSDERTITNSFSEQLILEEDDQSLFLNPSMRSMRAYGLGAQNVDEHLSFEGAAEYYWSILIEPLQR